MAWSFKTAIENVTKWNAAAVENEEEGISESKSAAATALAAAGAAQTLAETKITATQAETIASEAAAKAESEPAEAVATTNIATLSGIPAASSTDGVTLSAGQNVLLTAQATATQNGLWKVEAGAWKRPASFPENSSQYGVFVPVVAGEVYSGAIWVLRNKVAITVEKTAQEWEVNSAGTGGIVAPKELVRVLGKETTGAGEGALEAYATLSFVEQTVHRGNTAVGYNAMRNFMGLLEAGLKLAKEAALGATSLECTGIETKAAHVWNGGNSNTPVIVFRKLPEGVTSPKANVAYFIVGGGANAMDLALTYKGTPIKVEGKGLTVAGTEMALLASAEDNTCIGSQAGLELTTGGGNTLIGEDAGHNLTTGEENTLIGCEVAPSLLSGNNNVAVGFHALESATSGGNTAIGTGAMFNNTTAEENTAVGNIALYGNATGTRNTALGFQALRANLAGSNTAIGALALKALTTGEENTGVGALALNALTAGGENVGIGLYVLGESTSGKTNTAVGAYAGVGNKTGSGNIMLGYKAGYSSAGSNELYVANNETTAWIRGAESGKKIGFCGKTPIEPHAATHTETTKALWEHLEALGLA